MMRTTHSYLLGYDCGSSSIKAAVIDAETGNLVASAHSPLIEMPISSPNPGWAEQDPELWWDNVVRVTALLREKLTEINPQGLDAVTAIGISYQMHGLVLLDKEKRVLCPAIIWCDSRAVEIGNKAYNDIGHVRCLTQLKNPPGNFTASKYRWIIEQHPEIAERTQHLLLPGDYIALRLTGEIQTTASGLSEMILWDYMKGEPADLLLKHYKIPPALLPSIVPTFGIQGRLRSEIADELGLPAGTPVTYRSGDQPNNAFSLSAMNPGDVATTAGTSGVIYAVSGGAVSDAHGRVNTFVHVNHRADQPRYGVLLCVNGCGILYSWLRGILSPMGLTPSYHEMNSLASAAPIGSDGLVILPYGNGAERTLENKNLGASVHHIQLLKHTNAHLVRASQEGVAFALCYGLEILRELGVKTQTLKAGESNLFLSPIFRQALSGASGCSIEILNTDGAQGAARGAGVGSSAFASFDEAYRGLKSFLTVEPVSSTAQQYQDAYLRWRETLTSNQRENEKGVIHENNRTSA